jgi:hypothetical protein
VNSLPLHLTLEPQLPARTHPDGDHIGGLGAVLRELPVGVLAVHDLGARGGLSLRASDAVKDLMKVADDHGVVCFAEPGVVAPLTDARSRTVTFASRSRKGHRG